MQEQLPSIENIIVPLDGSDLAEAALPIATAIASASGAHIDLVTVALTYEVPLDNQMDTLTREALHRAEAAIRARHPKVGQTVLAGTPADEICNYARESMADLIVMATHGRSGLRKLILGSASDRVISLSSVPVLLVRASSREAAELSAEEQKIRRIVLPLDGREATPKAVPHALSLAKTLSTEVVLVTADEGGSMEAAERQLRAFSNLFEEQGITVSEEVKLGKPGEVIAGTAHEDDLIIMSSLGATGVAKGAHRGSVADYVIKNAAAPVLVVVPRGYLGSALE